MNKTKSGAWAVGQSMSLARIRNEAEYAMNNSLKALCKTDEGMYLKRVFTSKSGIREDDKHYDEYLYEFVRGFLFNYELTGILKAQAAGRRQENKRQDRCEFRALLERIRG